MPNVHKNKLPVPLRQVVSQYSSLFAVASEFVDYKLNLLTKFVERYIHI